MKKTTIICILQLCGFVYALPILGMNTSLYRKATENKSGEYVDLIKSTIAYFVLYHVIVTLPIIGFFCYHYSTKHFVFVCFVTSAMIDILASIIYLAIISRTNASKSTMTGVFTSWIICWGLRYIAFPLIHIIYWYCTRHSSNGHIVNSKSSRASTSINSTYASKTTSSKANASYKVPSSVSIKTTAIGNPNPSTKDSSYSATTAKIELQRHLENLSIAIRKLIDTKRSLGTIRKTLESINTLGTDTNGIYSIADSLIEAGDTLCITAGEIRTLNISLQVILQHVKAASVETMTTGEQRSHLFGMKNTQYTELLENLVTRVVAKARTLYTSAETLSLAASFKFSVVNLMNYRDILKGDCLHISNRLDNVSQTLDDIKLSLGSVYKEIYIKYGKKKHFK